MVYWYQVMSMKGMMTGVRSKEETERGLIRRYTPGKVESDRVAEKGMRKMGRIVELKNRLDKLVKHRKDIDEELKEKEEQLSDARGVLDMMRGSVLRTKEAENKKRKADTEATDQGQNEGSVKKRIADLQADIKHDMEVLHQIKLEIYTTRVLLQKAGMIERDYTERKAMAQESMLAVDSEHEDEDDQYENVGRINEEDEEEDMDKDNDPADDKEDKTNDTPMAPPANGSAAGIEAPKRGVRTGVQWAVRKQVRNEALDAAMRKVDTHTLALESRLGITEPRVTSSTLSMCLERSDRARVAATEAGEGLHAEAVRALDSALGALQGVVNDMTLAFSGGMNPVEQRCEAKDEEEMRRYRSMHISLQDRSMQRLVQSMSGARSRVVAGHADLQALCGDMDAEEEALHDVGEMAVAMGKILTELRALDSRRPAGLKRLDTLKGNLNRLVLSVQGPLEAYWKAAQGVKRATAQQSQLLNGMTAVEMLRSGFAWHDPGFKDAVVVHSRLNARLSQYSAILGALHASDLGMPVPSKGSRHQCVLQHQCVLHRARPGRAVHPAQGLPEEAGERPRRRRQPRAGGVHQRPRVRQRRQEGRGGALPALDGGVDGAAGPVAGDEQGALAAVGHPVRVHGGGGGHDQSGAVEPPPGHEHGGGDPPGLRVHGAEQVRRAALDGEHQPGAGGRPARRLQRTGRAPAGDERVRLGGGQAGAEVRGGAGGVGQGLPQGQGGRVGGAAARRAAEAGAGCDALAGPGEGAHGRPQLRQGAAGGPQPDPDGERRDGVQALRLLHGRVQPHGGALRSLREEPAGGGETAGGEGERAGWGARCPLPRGVRPQAGGRRRHG
eukprot:49501-Hanusia_phi.AAC.1